MRLYIPALLTRPTPECCFYLVPRRNLILLQLVDHSLRIYASDSEGLFFDGKIHVLRLVLLQLSC